MTNEYIVPLNDTAQDWDEMFVAVIRKQEELIRCKDCRRRAIWKHGSYKEGTKPVYRCVLMRTDIEPDDFCSHAEKKEGD